MFSDLTGGYSMSTKPALGRMLAMNTDGRNEMPPGFIRRSWTALIAFLRTFEPDYSEADYVLERVSRLDRDFAG